MAQTQASVDETRQRFYNRYSHAIGGRTWAHVGATPASQPSTSR